MKPTLRELAGVLKLVGAVLDRPSVNYRFDGRFAFRLDAGWSLVISADDAGRWRVEVCRGGRVRATMWCLADDRERLAELAAAARDEAVALAA